jgi:hypothetical protein
MASNVVARAASRAQTQARRGEYGPDSGDVAQVARNAMALSPAAAARVGATLLRAALEADPAVLSSDDVGDDVLAIGQLVLGLGPVAA